MYSAINFWMPTTEMKIKYLRANSGRLANLGGDTMGIIFWAALAMPFSSVLIAPWSGIGSVIFFLCYSGFSHRFGRTHDTATVLMMHQEAKATLQSNDATKQPVL